jgi:hypothetical protein
VLLPHLTELAVYDNSAEGDPALGKTPRPCWCSSSGRRDRRSAERGADAGVGPLDDAAARRLAPRTVVE